MMSVRRGLSSRLPDVRADLISTRTISSSAAAAAAAASTRVFIDHNTLNSNVTHDNRHGIHTLSSTVSGSNSSYKTHPSFSPSIPCQIVYNNKTRTPSLFYHGNFNRSKPFSTVSSSSHNSSSSSWMPPASSPAPPALPREEQRLFEELQKKSRGAFSSVDDHQRQDVTSSKQPQQQPQPQTNTKSAPSSSPSSSTEPSSSSSSSSSSIHISIPTKTNPLHPDVRRGAKPEFEGEVNPKTGEIGGPKNDPLRWGHAGDWSYNGRVTDF